MSYAAPFAAILVSLTLLGMGCVPAGKNTPAPVHQSTDRVSVTLNLPKVQTKLLEEDMQEFAAEQIAEVEQMAIEGEKYEVRIDGEVFRWNDLETAMLRTYTYTGGAHGNTVYTALRRDTRDGSKPELIDLFNLQTQYWEVLSRIARRELPAMLREKEMEVPSMLEDGTAPDEKNFKNWAGTPDGLLIVFDPYQVAPYAAGEQRLVIPWAELKSMLETRYK